MPSTNKIRFSDKCRILAEFYRIWDDWRDEPDNDIHEDWAQFMRWANIALPLAYIIENDFVTKVSNEGTKIINETYDVACKMMGVPNNKPFANVDDMYSGSESELASLAAERVMAQWE